MRQWESAEGGIHPAALARPQENAVSPYAHLHQQGRGRVQNVTCRRHRAWRKSQLFLAPPPDAFRLANKLLHMYSGHFSNCCFCFSPRMSGSLFKPFKRSISDPYSLLRMLDLGPVGFQSQAIWGPHLSGADPKGWGAQRGAQTP